MKVLGVKMYMKLRKLLNNEKGAQTLEWLGLAAFLIMLIGIISALLKGQSGALSDIIGKIIKAIGDQIQ